MTLAVEQIAVLVPVMALGAYIQAVTGFAMGLVVVGASGVLDMVPIGVMAASVSIMTLFNAGTALYGRTHLVDRRLAVPILATMVPGVVAGVLLLEHLSATWAEILNALLGGFILMGGTLLTLKPSPRPAPSGPARSLAVGTLGGLFTGLFATGGPPVVYHLYREPAAVASVRVTLLAVFFVSAATRVSYLGMRGSLTPDILLLSGLGIPLVVAATGLGRRFPPPLSDLQMRRAAFALLIAIGVTLLLT